jgi:peptide-methionine (R)-S-oxide reductase
MRMRYLLLLVIFITGGCGPDDSVVATKNSQQEPSTSEMPNSDDANASGQAVVPTAIDGMPPLPSTPTATENEKTNTDTGSKAMPKFNELTDRESYVILKKGTERAFTGEYWATKTPGTYICRRCNAPLYRSTDKFESDCGWPSFDDEIKGAVRREEDDDGHRTEILCENCGGHLGHVFIGERFTQKNTRHCVNSLSMKLIPEGTELPAVITVQE